MKKPTRMRITSRSLMLVKYVLIVVVMVASSFVRKFVEVYNRSHWQRSLYDTRNLF
jgi:hypothetical protein